MTHPRNAITTVVAILGADTVVENALAQLPEGEGHSTRHLEAHPAGLMDELLDGVDILLLAPGLKDGVRDSFLEAMSSTPKAEAIPVLTLPATLKLALHDELSAGVSWGSLFEELVRRIAAALQRAAASAGARVV
jgi:hypothetical protein